MLKGLDSHRVARDGRWHFERKDWPPTELMGKGKGRSKGEDIPLSGGIEDLHEAQTLRSLTTSMRAWTVFPIKGKSSTGRADQSTSLSPIFSLLDLENDFAGKKREKDQKQPYLYT